MELGGGMNDQGVGVLNAETLSGDIGKYLVELEVPTTTTPGPYQSVVVQVKAGSQPYSNTVYIPIR